MKKRDFTGTSISCSGLLRPSALPSSQLLAGATATYLYETTERTLALSIVHGTAVHAVAWPGGDVAGFTARHRRGSSAQRSPGVRAAGTGAKSGFQHPAQGGSREWRHAGDVTDERRGRSHDPRQVVVLVRREEGSRAELFHDSVGAARR